MEEITAVELAGFSELLTHEENMVDCKMKLDT